MEDHILSLPLLATPTPAAAAADDDHNGINFLSSFAIISRFLLVILIGTISIWANHEESKGFKVTIINKVAKDSPAGKRFALFYESNDEATRIILNTSAVVENILYHPTDSADIQTKKPVHHVVLQLASNNLTSKVIVETNKSKEFVHVISLSSTVMEERNVKHAVISAIQRAVARIWLWDGEFRAPPWLIDGMVEYILMQAGFGEGEKFGGHEKETALLHPGLTLIGPEQICVVVSEICKSRAKSGGDLCRELDKSPNFVAEALGYLEQQRKGYIRGLNQILRHGWDENQPCHAMPWMMMSR